MASDLDHILMGGEQLYKSLSIQNDVDVEEIPREIVVFSHTVTLEISKESLNEGKFVQGEPFIGNVLYFLIVPMIVQDLHCFYVVMQLP